jgi:hypothetical protein
MNHASNAALRRHFPHAVPGRNSARASSHAKIAYSVTWAAFRAIKTVCCKRASEISGTKNLTIGAIRRELLCEDFLSPEAEKIRTIQIRTGTQ